MGPITKSRCLTCLALGLIDPCEPFQPEITVTWVTLEAKNVPWNPPQTWGFQAKNKKDPLQRLFWNHCALGMPPITPITKSRCLTCPLDLMDPNEPHQPEITVTWVTFEANNLPLKPGDF